MKKKPVILGISVVGLATLLSSCFGGDIDVTPDLTVDVTNHEGIKINAYFPDFGCDESKVKNGYLGKEIIAQTTYDVNYVTLTSAADTEINAILTNKEPVDMLKCAPTVFNAYVTQGYFTDLTDLIAKYGDTPVDSNGTKFKDIWTKEQWASVTYNDKIYAIPEIGHTYMASQAIIWNKDHLNTVGVTKIPETISEFKTALHLLQAHYGIKEPNYHAFGLTGNIAVNNPLAPAFDCPYNWYEDSAGKLKPMTDSLGFENYERFVNSLLRDDIIVGDWSMQQEPFAISNFVKEYCSCYVGSYWNIKNLRSALVASYKSFPEEVISTKQKTKYVRGESGAVTCKDDGLVSWRVGLKGDGTEGSPVQSVAKFRDAKATGYFITIPVATAKRAAYTIDWIIRKNHEDVTRLVAAGTEGIHWNYCEATDEGAIKLNCAEPKYVKKLDRYDEDISGMEQFQTGVYCDAARQWWPLAEAGFDAWNVLIVDEQGNEDESRMILNPFASHPVISSFAKQDLKGQNYVITQAQNIINARTVEVFEERLATARSEYNSKYYNKFADDINEWYSANKK